MIGLGFAAMFAGTLAVWAGVTGRPMLASIGAVVRGEPLPDAYAAADSVRDRAIGAIGEALPDTVRDRIVDEIVDRITGRDDDADPDSGADSGAGGGGGAWE